MIVVFFFNDTATTEIYTLSLHDALPIYVLQQGPQPVHRAPPGQRQRHLLRRDPALAAKPRMIHEVHSRARDRKSTRLNSSHANISYAVFCLKKKKKHTLMCQHTANYLTS